MTATVVLTFDNLGEALEIERGEWDGSRPLGGHPSVTIALPRLLDALAEHRLAATFCVEAINCGLNPDAVREIAHRGHEVAGHAFRHEVWAELDADREDAQLARCRLAFAELGLEPIGFRPPGGGLTPATPGLLSDHGFTWCSPARDPTPPPSAGVAWVPFGWELVDATYLLGMFDGLRAAHGLPRAPLSPEAAGERMRAHLGAGPGPHVLILHPFVMLDDRWWAQVQALLAELAARVREGDARVITAAQAAGG